MKKLILLVLGVLVIMIPLTFKELKGIAPRGNNLILMSFVEFQGMLEKYGLNTKQRQAYFMAQLAHESDGFKVTEEYASGRAYEGRRDLGNTQPGDGVRYKGRGLIQLTGRANYKAMGIKLGVDLESNPEKAAEFPAALEIALIYWNSRNCSAHADKGDFKKVTKLINGGLNGYKDRQVWLERFNKLLESKL